MSNIASPAVAVIVLLVVLACYFLPTLVAALRGKIGAGGVFFVNLFLGWTVVGWFVAFIWACSGRTEGDASLEARRHAEMLAVLAGKQQPERQLTPVALLPRPTSREEQVAANPERFA
jgi:hypothetical protein